jgi:hypothetical protein
MRRKAVLLRRVLQVWRTLRGRVTDAIVQDVPPELSACEVCGRASCNTEEWLKCEQRLAVAEYMRTGHHRGLAMAKAASDKVTCAAVLPPQQAEPDDVAR